MKQQLWILNSSLVVLFFVALNIGNALRRQPPVAKRHVVAVVEEEKKKKSRNQLPLSFRLHGRRFIKMIFLIPMLFLNQRQSSKVL
jgi:hypothetical protein